MDLIFADDSGKDATRSRYLVVASVAFDESRLPALESKIASLKKRYGIPAGCELHWANRKYRFPRQKPKESAELTRQQHHELRSEFLGFLDAADATAIIGAVEHRKSRSLADHVCWCLDFITERTQMRLQDVARETGRKALGLLIVDEAGSKRETAKVRDHLVELHRSGTRYIDRIDTLVMNSVVYPSDLVPGIQLADFVAGAFDRFVNRQEEEWWEPIAPCVRCDPKTGYVLGRGLKLWPKKASLQVGKTIVR